MNDTSHTSDSATWTTGFHYNRTVADTSLTTEHTTWTYIPAPQNIRGWIYTNAAPNLPEYQFSLNERSYPPSLGFQSPTLTTEVSNRFTRLK